MAFNDIQLRVRKLRKLIDYHRTLYHTFDAPELSDAAFDALKNELEELENKYTELRTADSPTQKVGGKPLAAFQKVTHEAPMLSLTDAFSRTEMEEWLERLSNYLKIDSSTLTREGFYCELKIDGLAVEFVYENSRLVQASTRGDGRVGEDITQNVLNIPTIPHELVQLGKHKIPDHLVVRGEIYITRKELEQINHEQERLGLKPYANPRNLAAGSIRQLDPKVAASRAMMSFQYDITSPFSFKPDTHEEKHRVLASWGFTVNSHNRSVKTLEDVLRFRDMWEGRRGMLPYEIDGTVVILNSNPLFERAGIAGKAPRAATAYKFSPREATTHIKAIHVQVGRTGVLTPVAVLTPVNLGGVTITHATLHNADEIKRLDVRVGDTVVVSRAGDVIPKITSVMKELRVRGSKPFPMPVRCPADGSAVIREGALYRCANPLCGARVREQLYHFVSRHAFDIRGLGPKIIDRFLDEGLITDPGDIFFLTKADISALPRFGEKSAQNLIREIGEKKSVTLPRFLFALGILNVGEETARLLARAFPAETVSEVLTRYVDLSEEALSALHDVGPVATKTIRGWFAEKKNKELLKKLERAGVGFMREKNTGGKLTGKTFVLTGMLEQFSRDEAAERIRSLGGSVSASVSRATSYVVAGSNPGSKLEKAKKLGVIILSEGDFSAMLG